MSKFSFDPTKHTKVPNKRQQHARSTVHRASIDAPPALIRDRNVEPQSPPQTKTKTELHVTEEDWNTVLRAFKKTGNASRIARQTDIPRQTILSLISKGIPRLGLPPIHDYAIDTAEVNLALHRVRKERQTSLERKDVQEAVTERAITEGTSAQQLLEQATQTGALLGTMVDRMTKQLISGKSEMLIPEEITPHVLETLAKVADANSRTMERAVKLVRLTAGEATELIEHKIAHLIANCTTEELAQASLTGSLPKRLTSRSGQSADPMSTAEADVAGNISSVIDVDFTEGSTHTPSWKKSVTYEGQSTDEDNTDSSK